MEPIRDLSWMAHLAGGETLERFELYGYRAVAVRVDAKASRRGETYRYRLFFTPPAERHPIYAINLETSILGEWMLTEQVGTGHRIVKRLPSPLDYDTFRVLALERAVEALKKTE